MTDRRLYKPQVNSCNSLAGIPIITPKCRTLPYSVAISPPNFTIPPRDDSTLTACPHANTIGCTWCDDLSSAAGIRSQICLIKQAANISTVAIYAGSPGDQVRGEIPGGDSAAELLLPTHTNESSLNFRFETDYDVNRIRDHLSLVNRSGTIRSKTNLVPSVFQSLRYDLRLFGRWIVSSFRYVTSGF